MGTKSRKSLSALRSASRQNAPPLPERKPTGWNKRMLGYRRPAQPSLTLGDALNGGLNVPLPLLRRVDEMIE